MNRIITLLCTSALIFCLTTVASANFIVNGSFEDPDISSSWDLVDSSSVPGWTGGNVNGIPTDIEIQSEPIFGWSAADGQQWVELDSNAPYYIFQTVTLLPNTTYELNFAFSSRPDTAAVDNQLFWGVGQGSTYLATNVIPGPTIQNNTDWTYYSPQFSISGSSQADVRIIFGDCDLGVNDGTSGLGPLLDDVSLYSAPTSNPIPEPTTWLLFGTGLLGLVGFGRRKFIKKS